MKFGGIDYDADELNELHRKYKIGDKIIDSDIYISKIISPVICYSHVDLSGGKFSFNQELFGKDSHNYFEKIKALCDNSIDGLLNEDNNGVWHLHPTRGKNILNELKRHFNKKNIDNLPEIYHFALYTDKDIADKSTGKRSPRIHFIVGSHGMLYPLFYDPYHEINP
ncbi:MAG: hypothetical protein IJY31_06090 [Muribaculaceae bacterium]|nr:hypothetical protein [Muribaculaceae bacterium]